MKNSKEINFWWDFEGEDMVIVESSDKENPLVAVFYQKRKLDATEEISKAENLIKRLQEGKLNYKVLAQSFDKEFVKIIYPNYKGEK